MTTLVVASGVVFALTSNETAAEATPTHVSAVSVQRSHETTAAKPVSQTKTTSAEHKAAASAKATDQAKAAQDAKAPASSKQAAATTAAKATAATKTKSPAAATTATAAASSTTERAATTATHTQAAPAQATAQTTATAAPAHRTATVARRATPVRRTAAPAAATGFTVGGHSFGIRAFSGVGQVPGDSYVYQWTAVANHYLIEYTGAAHAYLAGVGIGSAVSVNGHVYHVRKISYSVANNQASVTNMLAQKRAIGGISFQTCVPNGQAVPPLNIYYAN